MRNNHVLNLLEEKGLNGLSADERTAVEEHARTCAPCMRAYRIAQLSNALLAERSAASIEPPPSFQSRLMAALREARAAQDQPLFARIWRAAGTLVATLIAVIVVLLAVNIYTVRSQRELAASPNSDRGYSLESVMTDESHVSASQELTSGQVIEALFTSEDTDGDR